MCGLDGYRGCEGTESCQLNTGVSDFSLVGLRLSEFVLEGIHGWRSEHAQTGEIVGMRVPQQMLADSTLRTEGLAEGLG